MMIDFEDKMPAKLLTLGEKGLLTFVAVMQLYGLYATAIGVIQWFK